MQKYSGGSECCSTLAYPFDHEKSGKSTTSFIQEFIQTLTILNVNKDFCGKLCMSVLFNDVNLLQSSFIL